MDFTPHVTVAAVAERDGRFLLVEERVNGEVVINQPAGHWEDGETLVDACAREAREETAWEFMPEALIGVYRHIPLDSGETYMRFAFCGRLVGECSDQSLDEGIVRVAWMLRNEVATLDPQQRRSPLVLQCIDDYLAGIRHPLSLLNQFC